MRFDTVVELHGKTATGLTVPDEVVAALGAGKRPPVVVGIGEYRYRTTVAPMGGQYFIPLSAEHRQGAGVKAGDLISVEIALDTEPRVVEVPADFAAALAAAPAALARFEKLSYTHRKEHVRAIEEAKAPATRERRISKALEMLGVKET